MPKIKSRVTFNTAGAVARIKAANNAGLTAMGNQALQDATEHVPKDQGDLKDSGISDSDKRAEDGKFTLRWDQPYAKYLWHGEVMHGPPGNRTYSADDKITFTSALAHEQWAEYAKEVYGEQWKKVYEAAMRKELRK